MKKTQVLLKIALLTALTTAVSMLFVFPVPAANGIVTLAEAGIYISALILGPLGGLWVGALSGGLIDLLSGYPQWAFFSIIIHGLQGFLTGYLYEKIAGKYKLIVSLIVGSIVMVVGYLLATIIMYNLAAGIVSVPANIIQNIVGMVVAVPLVTTLKKLNIKSIEGDK